MSILTFPLPYIASQFIPRQNITDIPTQPGCKAFFQGTKKASFIYPLTSSSKTFLNAWGKEHLSIDNFGKIAVPVLGWAQAQFDYSIDAVMILYKGGDISKGKLFSGSQQKAKLTQAGCTIICKPIGAAVLTWAVPMLSSATEPVSKVLCKPVCDAIGNWIEGKEISPSEIGVNSIGTVLKTLGVYFFPNSFWPYLIPATTNGVKEYIFAQEKTTKVKEDILIDKQDSLYIVSEENILLHEEEEICPSIQIFDNQDPATKTDQQERFCVETDEPAVCPHHDNSINNFGVFINIDDSLSF